MSYYIYFNVNDCVEAEKYLYFLARKYRITGELFSLCNTQVYNYYEESQSKFCAKLRI